MFSISEVDVFVATWPPNQAKVRRTSDVSHQSGDFTHKSDDNYVIGTSDMSNRMLAPNANDTTQRSDAGDVVKTSELIDLTAPNTYLFTQRPDVEDAIQDSDSSDVTRSQGMQLLDIKWKNRTI